MEEFKDTEELIEEIMEEDEIVQQENTDDELLDLLEEEPNEEDEYPEQEERTASLINEFRDYEEDELDDFDIDKYLMDNFSFKEIESIPFEEYKEQELQKPDVQTVLKLYERGLKLKGLDTFDDFLQFKKKHVYVYLVTIGLPFEYQMFGLEPKIFICKAFTTADYSAMLKVNPEADKDIDFFNDYMLSECILFPEFRMEDIPKLEIGITDVLLPMIMKNSRFDANYQIKRL